MKIKYFVRAETMVQHLTNKSEAIISDMAERNARIQVLENPAPGLIVYQGQANEIKDMHYHNAADRERLKELKRTIQFLETGDAGQLVDVTEEI